MEGLLGSVLACDAVMTRESADSSVRIGTWAETEQQKRREKAYLGRAAGPCQAHRLLQESH